MKFKHEIVNRKERYSLGTESESGRLFASIPVTKPLVDYLEYYEITPEEMERFKRDPAAALAFIERCRKRLEDARLMEPAQSDRGIPA